MVQSRARRWLLFAAFVLPALVLYSIFFVAPFTHGAYISLTNWDGLTPRAPIRFEPGVFEERVLDALEREADRRYLRSVYSLDPSDGSWSRLSLSGIKRRRVESLLSKAGYVTEKNRFVGIGNYAAILGGKVSDSFYPRHYEKSWYSANSLLPAEISPSEAERNILPNMDAASRAAFEKAYFRASSGDGSSVWALDPSFDEYAAEDKIWLIDEAEKTGKVTQSEVRETVNAVKKASLERDRASFDRAVAAFVDAHRLSSESEASVNEGARRLWELGEIKLALSAAWKTRGFDLGVTGFTAFFAFFSVIGINLLAFALALALDSGMRGQKILRSIFFIPNVLSMIIVALIWKMLFFQLFPALTGVDQWLSDPAKTPWLIVLVAVWQGAGYYMIVYLAGLQNIPVEAIEAARIDGASPVQRFFLITLPLLVPAITVSLFLTVANALKSFDLIYAMTSGSAYTYGTVPFVLDIFFDAFARKQAGMATAKAMLLFAIIFAITGLQLWAMKRKEVEQ